MQWELLANRKLRNTLPPNTIFVNYHIKDTQNEDIIQTPQLTPHIQNERGIHVEYNTRGTLTKTLTQFIL